MDRHELAPEQLRWRCDPAQYFPFETTAELEPKEPRIIGQPRAVEALKLGLALRSPGSHIFVVGDVGTGRSSAVRRQLDAVDPGEIAPHDLCYVYNFEEPGQPKLLSFPAGRGVAFREAMKEMVDRLRKELTELFGSEIYRERKTEVSDEVKVQNRELLKEFEKLIEEDGFVLVQIQSGEHIELDLMRMVDGKPKDIDELENLVKDGTLSREEYDHLQERYDELSSDLEVVSEQLGKLEKGLKRKLIELDRSLAQPRVQEAIATLRSTFEGAEVGAYLDAVTSDILDHLDRFQNTQEPATSGARLDRARQRIRERLLPYAVNVLVDNAKTKGRPILWENTPIYRNVFGTIERIHGSGNNEWRTDHTRIKAGSLLKANGGILVLDAMDVLAEEGVWSTLKRALRTRVLEIRAFDPMHLMEGVHLKPQLVPIDVKLILIGTRHIYRVLSRLDEDFKKIFKIKAEFAHETQRGTEEIDNYAVLARRLVQDESLLPIHREALSSIVEHAVRAAGHRDKISTRFPESAELIREADYWARQAGALRIERAHVEQAIERQKHRLDLVEERLREEIVEGSVLLDLDGEKVGQINGLVVLSGVDRAFGLPTRITATTAMGRSGILNIEREARMSGPTHTKGVLILAGFLRSRFAQDKPLTLTASLCFEQSYGGVEGDSASAAELCVLLSSLSRVPLRQSLAITGSVNQRGEIQPIGGIHEKIEGFFDLCKVLGLTGRHGVVIPSANVQNLQLRPDVVEAVRAGKFHVYAVSTIDECLELFTPQPASVIFERTDAELRRLESGIREHGLADLRLGGQ